MGATEGGVGLFAGKALTDQADQEQVVAVKLDEPWAIRERSILVRELEALPGTIRALIATLMPDPLSAG